jgi:hypothetical protein
MNISIVIPGLSLHHPDPLAHPLGGSESAGLQLSAELARVGYGPLNGHKYTVAARQFGNAGSSAT